jgi:fructosamine-3-kinase
MLFEQIIEDQLLEEIVSISSISGGDINAVYKITTKQNTYVLKINNKSTFPQMFEKEKLGLEMLVKSGVKSPEVILTFSDTEYQFLLLEFIEEETENHNFWKNFAKDLVKIHKTNSETFGLDYDNYIGSLKQSNKQNNSWESFFVENRISPLVEQAFNKKLLLNNHLKSFENLFYRLNEILPKENPALIHGDLWSGNLMKGIDQTPVFIDPAIYFGNREMDIAMTQMFGGFNNNFIDYYEEIYPLEKDWQNRLEIHNLYPTLVHLILFGKSYLSSIENVILKY